jgi:hypothetical protein
MRSVALEDLAAGLVLAAGVSRVGQPFRPFADFGAGLAGRGGGLVAHRG